MPLSFPLSPTIGQTYTYASRSWTWNGVVWKSVGTIQGAQGIQGFQGTSGLNGAQGLQGPNAAVYFSTTPPVSPLIGDRWVDSNSGSEYRSEEHTSELQSH